MQPSARGGSTSADRSDSHRPRKQRDRGPRGYSPMNSGSTYNPEEEHYWLEHEMGQLERALAEKGDLPRGELGELVGCKYWGPGRYSRALRAAVEDGRIKRVARGRYGPPTEGER